MASTTNKALNLPDYNSLNWNTPLNANFSELDSILGSSTSTINIAAGNYDLSATQIQNMRIVLGGTLLGDRIVTFPSGVGGYWIVSNGATNSGTNAYTVTMQVIGGPGTSVVVPIGKNLIVFSDGTNVYAADNGIISVDPTFNSITISPTTTPAGTDNLFLIGNDIMTSNVNGVAGIRINYHGYNNGTTQFRNFTIYDGKENVLMSVTGATATFAINGTVSVNGRLNAQGSTTALGLLTNNIVETSTVSATAASGTINYDLTTQSIVQYTTAATDNWTLNLRGNGTNTLNSLMSTGQSLTVAFLAQTNTSTAQTATMTIAAPAVVTVAAAPNSGTPIVFSTTGTLPTGILAGTTYYVLKLSATTFSVAATVGGSAITTTGSQSGTHTVTTLGYFNNAFQIDGVAQTVKWQGGTTPKNGNASSTDAYTYTVMKTAASTYNVFGSLTRFA